MANYCRRQTDRTSPNGKLLQKTDRQDLTLAAVSEHKDQECYRQDLTLPAVSEHKGQECDKQVLDKHEGQEYRQTDRQTRSHLAGGG